MKSFIITVLLINLSLTLPTQAAITLFLSNTSTNSQLDFVVTGTLESSDFGENFLSDQFPSLWIYKDGLDWTTSSLANVSSGSVNGGSLTAPAIVNGMTYLLANNNTATGTAQDVISLNWANLEPAVESTDFAVGQVLDWGFSVRNFNAFSIDFELLRSSEIPFSAQLGSGAVIPEPSTYALFAGFACFIFLCMRRRNSSGNVPERK